MKTQKTLYILTGIVILSLFVYLGIQNHRINRLNDANQLQAVKLSILNDSVFVHKNKAGELSYKLISVEIEKNNLRQSLEIAGYDIKKLKESDIAWRKITNALKLELEASGHGETAVTDTFRIETGKTDTIYFQAVNDWSNNYLSLFNSKVESSKLFFDYRYKTGLTIVQEPKRKETLVSVFLTDPNAAITSANSITVTHKRRFWEKPWLWFVAGLTTGLIISK